MEIEKGNIEEELDDIDDEKKSSRWSKKIKWNETFDWNLMDYFSKANLFILCCVAACFSLIIYLAAFSCEVSWILEAHGNLPTPAYLLCTFYFILFVASTILIHGLATGLSWGLFTWSIVIGFLAIPELCLVMYMTIQYWGLQSTHGLVELVSYLVRLVLTCLALLCVIPTALRWRREKQVLTQLQTLASRLQLPQIQTTTSTTHTTTSSSINHTFNKGTDSIRNSNRKNRQNRRVNNGFDNPGFALEHTIQMMPYNPYGPYGSQNEFNASIFGLNPSQYIGPPPPPQNKSKRTQSLLDLRYVMQPTQLMNSKEKPNIDEIDHQQQQQHLQQQQQLNNDIQQQQQQTTTTTKNDKKSKKIFSSPPTQDDNILSDPIYYTIDSYKSTKPLGRNCVSLENLTGITSIKNDLSSYGNNLLQNYTHWPIITYHPNIHNYPIQYYNYHVPIGYNNYNNNNNPYMNSSNNSRQSLGSSTDDYRKYRDVAL